MIGCGLLGCTRLNPGFGDASGGTGSSTSDTTPGETTVGADASAGSVSGASTTKPTRTTSPDTGDPDTSDPDTNDPDTSDPGTSDEGTTSATRASAAMDGSNSDDTADATDSEPPSDLGLGLCGDGALDRGEACEPGIRVESSCADLEYGAGFVECAADCTLEPRCCGDGDIDDGEMCEPGQMTECPPYGGNAPTLVCTVECQLPEPGCPQCGDGLVQESIEDCEPGPARTCEDLGFDGAGNIVTCVDCLWVSDGCCIPDGEPCSLGPGIGCCSDVCTEGTCGGNL